MLLGCSDKSRAVFSISLRASGKDISFKIDHQRDRAEEQAAVLTPKAPFSVSRLFGSVSMTECYSFHQGYAWNTQQSCQQSKQ